MKFEEFKNLKVGDMCRIIRGHDADRLCQVAYIEGEAVVVRSADGCRFYSMNIYEHLKITSYRELKLDKQES